MSMHVSEPNLESDVRACVCVCVCGVFVLVWVCGVCMYVRMCVYVCVCFRILQQILLL